MKISRGALVIVVLPGDYGKPRPALIVQSDAFRKMVSLTVLPLTGDLQPAQLVRISIEPNPENGLERRSQIMVDKAATVSRAKIGRHIGNVDSTTMGAVDRALLRFFDLG